MSAAPLGIDLGTTSSTVAYCAADGAAQRVTDASGQPLVVPARITLAGAQVTVGTSDAAIWSTEPLHLAEGFKRHLADREWAFAGASGDRFGPEELTALLLRKLVRCGEHALGAACNGAVVTVPATFAHLERNRTKQAGDIAGVEVLGLLDEPLAAAIAYRSASPGARNLLVHNWGDGALELALIGLRDDGVVEVIANTGSRQLGGWQIDQALMELARSGPSGPALIDVGDHQLRAAMRSAKASLTDVGDRPLLLERAPHAGERPTVAVPRAAVDAAVAPFLDAAHALCRRLLREARAQAVPDCVLLIGGLNEQALFRDNACAAAGCPPAALQPGTASSLAAAGAALYAAQLHAERSGTDTGAALPPLRVRNVTTHTLGVHAIDPAGGAVNSRIIPRNSELPASGTRTYTTQTPDQTAVKIQLIQGEHRDPARCMNVGEARILIGLPDHPREPPRIEVRLGYDASGIVHLDALEVRSGRRLKSRITGSGLLSAEQVEAAAARLAALPVD